MPIVACFNCGKERNITYQQMTRTKYTGLCTTCNRKLHKGSGNPNWKNGFRSGGEGGKYILRYIPEHPSADSKGYVLEHRLVAEKILGRYLTADEIIHHLDNNPANNNPENIVILANQRCHAKLHRFLEKTRQQTLKAVGEWLEGKMFAVPLQGVEWHIRLDEIESLKEGKMPK